MGAIATLLLLPVMAPAWGFRFVMERLRDEAESVMNDEGRGFADLIELSMLRSAGKISDAEYAEREKMLLDRLSAIRDRREELMNAELGMDDEESFDAGADTEYEEAWLVDDEPAEEERPW